MPGRGIQRARRVVRKGLPMKVNCEHEGGSHLAIWQESVPGRRPANVEAVRQKSLVCSRSCQEASVTEGERRGEWGETCWA